MSVTANLLVKEKRRAMPLTVAMPALSLLCVSKALLVIYEASCSPLSVLLNNIVRTWFIIFVVFLVTAAYGTAVMIHMFLWKNHDVFYAYTRSWARFVLKISRVQVVTVGTDEIRPEERYVYIANHASLFDIPVLIAAVPDNFRIIYKRELQKIPIFGWCIRMSPFIAIDRERSRDAVDVLDTVSQTMRQGSSVLIFPEGTRSDSGIVGEFRRGAFSLAARSGRSIIPISIVGTRNTLPKKTRHIQGGLVTIHVGSPITVPEVTTREAERNLMEHVRQIISNTVDSYL